MRKWLLRLMGTKAEPRVLTQVLLHLPWGCHWSGCAPAAKGCPAAWAGPFQRVGCRQVCLLPHICPFSQALALETRLLAASLDHLSKLRLSGALPGLLVASSVHTVPSQSPLRLSRWECCSLSPMGSRRIKHSRLKLADTNEGAFPLAFAGPGNG